MFKFILFVSALASTTPALASWHYVPAGHRITLEQAAANLAAGQRNFGVTFAENQMFIEFGDYEKPATHTWAVTNNVAAFEKAVDAKIPGKIVQSGSYRYQLGWNKLARIENNNQVEMVYSAFDDFREQIKGRMKPGGFKNQEDSRGYILYLDVQGYTLLSLAGPDVTYYAETGGDGGGAHPFAWSGMKHKNFGYGASSLVDIVDNQGLLDALKANPAIRQSAGPALDSITQLTDFDRQGRDLTMNMDNGTAWSMVEGEQWKEFSIWDYDPATQMATIRIGLEYTSEAVRGSFSQLEVKVKVVDDTLAQLLADVKSGKIAGLLMKDVPASQQPPTDGR